MELVRIYVFGLLTLFSACNNKSEFIITIKANNTNYDTLFIQELISGRTMAKVPLNSLNKNYTFNIDETKLALLSLSGTESTYMAIIRPGVKKIIIIDSTFIKTKKSIPDSLINYFASSTNQLLSEYSDFIFTKDNPEKVKFIFDSLVQVRNKILNTYKSQLTADEFGILEYQNRARANSFLFYFGRILKKYTPDNKFFDFINNIDNENIYSKSLPDNLLYKYEIQILRERDTIENVDVFIKFIEEKTKSKNLQDYLKAIYLKSVIESPSYWRRHEKLFTINTINDALQRESDNEYTYLIKSASNSLYASQKGVKGYDFNAFKSNGTKFNLSDLKGKICPPRIP